MYNLCGGERLAQYVRGANRSLFADLTPEQTLEFTYDVQQYRGGRSSELAAAGLSADYVLRETKRAIAGAGPRDEDLARHRRRHPHRSHQQEDAAGRCVSNV